MGVMFTKVHPVPVNCYPDFVRFIVRLAIAGEVEINPAQELRADEIFDSRF